MSKVLKRVLFISSEISPYLPDSLLSVYSKETIIDINKNSDFEIRGLSPKFGVINERKHQLHEVVRLSGMNISINDIPQPLIIKVASMPKYRVQVYFIDNDDYFARKSLYGDETQVFFEDNDERMLFFTIGVMEMIKKLGWAPDIIHIQGWLTYLIPIFVRKINAREPIFKNSKIVVSHFSDQKFEQSFSLTTKSKELKNLQKKSKIQLEINSYTDLLQNLTENINGIITNVDSDITTLIQKDTLHIVAQESNYGDEVVSLYRQLLENV